MSAISSEQGNPRGRAQMAQKGGDRSSDGEQTFEGGKVNIDPNKHQNELAAKLTAHQNAKAIEDASNVVETALNPFADADRKRVLDSALGKLKSNLAVFPGGGYGMVILYHRTAEAAAQQILAGGFRDGQGNYMTTRLHSGVWVSDQPLDENEGACGNALIRIKLAKDESEIAPYEWIEDGKPYREWLMPADLINEFGTVEIQEIDEEPNF
jgi:hypothetical protein